MKKLLGILLIAGTLTACGNDSEKKADDAKEKMEETMKDAKEKIREYNGRGKRKNEEYGRRCEG
ncbi:MAG: hypothetical protein IPH34_15190 [Chitinophagaceae bacterium]|nr:hypothetical protein [Chitinophagaceae bacterium]